MDKPFQRLGARSNAHVGRDFELIAQRFFASQGINLQRCHAVDIGIGQTKKAHAFDLGCDSQRVLVECKSHRWTAGHNIPNAKLTVWNEAMYYFHAAPSDYRKIMFVLKDLRRGTGESLCSYYLRICGHLVPDGVEFWEYDDSVGAAVRVGT
ncbi:MAG: hypothetical protein VX875_03075 [Pseudomonadota bacterium]|jgi:hypothetical protein|nr:hypothetical protein [Pseudomonadota bacterium]